jgi:hypothetical protein
VSDPISTRKYSEDELRAARRLGGINTGPGRGPIYFAAGPYWPTWLRSLAIKYRADADAAEIIADAMDREMALDPLLNRKTSQ